MPLLEDKLKPVKDEFLMLLEKWCQQKLGLSILDSEQLVLNNPVAMFSDFHGFYLANRKEARLFCVEFWVWLFTQISVWSCGMVLVFQVHPWENEREVANYFLEQQGVPRKPVAKQDHLFTLLGTEVEGCPSCPTSHGQISSWLAGPWVSCWRSAPSWQETCGCRATILWGLRRCPKTG